MLFYLPSLYVLSVNLSHTEAQCVGRVQVEIKQQIRFRFQKGWKYESIHVQLRGFGKKQPPSPQRPPHFWRAQVSGF